MSQDLHFLDLVFNRRTDSANTDWTNRKDKKKMWPTRRFLKTVHRCRLICFLLISLRITIIFIMAVYSSLGCPNSKHWFTTSLLQGRCRKVMLGVCRCRDLHFTVTAKVPRSIFCIYTSFRFWSLFLVFIQRKFYIRNGHLQARQPRS